MDRDVDRASPPEMQLVTDCWFAWPGLLPVSAIVIVYSDKLVLRRSAEVILFYRSTVLQCYTGMEVHCSSATIVWRCNTEVLLW